MAGALRLLFEWDNGRITLKDARPVAKRAPAGDPTPSADRARLPPQLGVTLELRIGEHATYRRQVAAMFPDSHEVQTGDPERPFARSPRTTPYQVELLVPMPDRTARLVVTEVRAGPKARDGDAPRAVVLVDEPLHVDEPFKPDADPRQGRP